MNPVIKHLQSMFPELPLAVESQSMPWTFNEDIKKLGPDFFSKVMLLHPVLTIEYSVLCYNLKHSLAIQSKVNNPALIEQLKAALILAELLEHVHLRYLVVPREVARLRGHQQTYRELLRDIAGYEFSPHLPGVGSVDVGLSITQRIRDEIAEYNWYRLLFTRSKRMLDLLDVVVTNSKQYHNFVTFMDKYTNTFFAYLGWVFFIPRLSVNSILLLKHTLPWPWMDDDEKAIAWYVRFMAHLQRRWFELGNDLVWITAGLLNCFVFVGALAPFGFYVTLAAFAFDVINTSVRAYIELSRLYTYNKQMMKKNKKQ